MKIDEIAKAILDKAADIGKQTWSEIRRAAPIFTKAYAKSLKEIAAGVGANEISIKEVSIFARNAELLLVMGIAHTTHVALVQVQKLFNAVLDVLRDLINKALGFPILST